LPSVSVVITTYNRSELLPRAIESALNAGTDLEVIVVDDCSTDDTPEVCAHIPGIRYVRLDANRGLANARNVGIAESSSEFIALLDDDDLGRRAAGLVERAALLVSDDTAEFDGQVVSDAAELVNQLADRSGSRSVRRDLAAVSRRLRESRGETARTLIEGLMSRGPR